MNSDAIELNNGAVLQLEAGNVNTAFEMLSQSAKIIANAGADHQHVNSKSATYRFHWSDCANAAKAPLRRRRKRQEEQRGSDNGSMTLIETDSPPSASTSEAESTMSESTISSSSSSTASSTTPQQQQRRRLIDDANTRAPDDGGNSAFLFLKALLVTTPGTSPKEIDALCPCGYAWVVWYNLALCCSLLGTRLGERGHKMLKTGFQLYSRVQRRVENESMSCSQWCILQMAVLNNQACIYQDFAMSEASNVCLDRLQSVITQSSIQGAERKMFLLNLQILGCSHFAPAA